MTSAAVLAARQAPEQFGRRAFCCGSLAVAGTFIVAGADPADAQPAAPHVQRRRSKRDPRSDLRADERVVIFTTAARQTPDGSGWLVPVHVWVSRPADSIVRMGLLERALTAMTGRAPDDGTRANFERRAGLLISDNKRRRRIVVRVGDTDVALPPTAPNGHASALLTISDAQARNAAAHGRLPLTAVMPAGDARAFKGEALLIADEGTSIVSDIDDTVKITHVTDRARMLAATFLDDFAAVPGMAERYRDWTTEGAALHFVSSSPWHLYEPLVGFMQDAGFPPASLALKAIRLKDRTILDLFRPGSRTKPPVLRVLLDRYPRRRFVLVGDSGEEDPEVYAGLARRYGDRIAAVYIRNVTGASAEDDRFKPLLAGPGSEKWHLFSQARELPHSLPK